MARLGWGEVLLNGVLAGGLYVMFAGYAYLILGPGGEKLAPYSIPLLGDATIEILRVAIVVGGLIYALAVDDTPARVFKGLLIGFIGNTLGFGLSTYIGLATYDVLQSLLSIFYGLPFIAASLATLITTAATITAVIVSAPVVGGFVAGFALALLPHVFGIVLNVYETLVYKPFKTALLKFVHTVATHARLGFLMPYGVFIASVAAFLLYLPVFFVIMFWVFGILVGATAGFFFTGLINVITSIIGGLTAIVISSVLNALTENLWRRISLEATIIVSPAASLLILAVTLIPLATVLLYSLAVLPAVALVVSIALVASPSMRAGLDKYIPMFVALFILQVLGVIVAAVAYVAANSAKGQDAIVHTLEFCAGVVQQQMSNDMFGKNGTPIAMVANGMKYLAGWFNCTIKALPYYNYTTKCFHDGAGYDVPKGRVYKQTPPFWWLPVDLWLKEPWQKVMVQLNLTDPYDAVCTPKFGLLPTT